MAGFVFLCLIWLALIRLALITVLSVVAAWRRVGDAGPGPELGQVTLLVPACNEAAMIANTLGYGLQSVARGASLIVVDDGSDDGTAEAAGRVLAERPRCEVIVAPTNEGKAHALNRGLARVTTAYVLTLDADTRVGPDAVGRALARLEAARRRDEAVDVVAFDVSVPHSASLFVELQGVEYDAALNFERRGQGLFHAVSVAPGAASLWRLESLREISGFSPDTVTEDVDATLRLAALGRASLHVPGAVAWTDPPANLRHLLAQRRRWCLGHYQNIARHWPRKDDAAAFTWLAFPNFVFLSAFLPALATASLGMLVFGTGGAQPAILASTALWLPLVYSQRILGLYVAHRPPAMAALVLEPFTTSLLHATAAVLVARLWVSGLFGEPVNPWSIRE